MIAEDVIILLAVFACVIWVILKNHIFHPIRMLKWDFFAFWLLFDTIFKNEKIHEIRCELEGRCSPNL